MQRLFLLCAEKQFQKNQKKIRTEAILLRDLEKLC